jgi:hypothetical protein
MKATLAPISKKVQTRPKKEIATATLGHPAPDAERLGRWQDVDRQNQVLIDDQRDEQYQTQEKRQEEPTQGTAKADLFPIRVGFPYCELAPVHHDLLQRLRVGVAVAPDQPEGDARSNQQAPQHGEKD